jgi:hypothetical protein
LPAKPVIVFNFKNQEGIMKTVLVLLSAFLISNFSSAQTPCKPTPPSQPFTNSVSFDESRSRYDFSYEDAGGSLRYEYRPASGGSFRAIRCLINGANGFHPSNVGGMSLLANDEEIYPWSGGVAYKLLSVEITADTLLTNWQMTYGTTVLHFSYRIYISGRTLVIQAIAEDAICPAFYLDRSEETKNPIIIQVPYLTMFNVLFANDVFVSMYLDWEKTNAAEINPLFNYFSTTSAYFAENAFYRPSVSEERRTVDETVYLTVSPSITDVLPNIPNPVSPMKAISADHLVFDLWSSPFASSVNYVERLINAGLEKIWVINHVWQNGGYDNKLPDVLPANSDYGGDSGLQLLSDTAADAGYLFALHENYIDFYPNAPSWNEWDISLNSDGSLKTAWLNTGTGVQSFQMKPSMAASYLEMFSPDIHEQYATTASFLDVHSAISPSGVIDYDEAVPSWGSFREALHLYQALPGKLRQFHEGPVSGEGNNHFLCIGYFDDIEAQINTGGYGNRSQGQWLPLLVDFDLYKMHDLCAVHGVGYYERFFCAESGEPAYKPFSLDFTKEYIATELAYGHGGFIPSPDRSPDFVAVAELEAQHVQSAQRLYADAKVVSIRYNDQGQEVDASEYIRRHPTTFNNIDDADFMGQVRVEYDNGVVVSVNRHPTREWPVHVEATGGSFNVHAIINGQDVTQVGSFSQSDFILPPVSGWLVYVPDPNAGVEEASGNSRPLSVQLSQNYPNPFNSSTVIEFTLNQPSNTTLQVFNLAGQLVETLINKKVQTGTTRCEWDAGNLAGGVYFYRLTAG